MGLALGSGLGCG